MSTSRANKQERHYGAPLGPQKKASRERPQAGEADVATRRRMLKERSASKPRSEHSKKRTTKRTERIGKTRATTKQLRMRGRDIDEAVERAR